MGSAWLWLSLDLSLIWAWVLDSLEGRPWAGFGFRRELGLELGCGFALSFGLTWLGHWIELGFGKSKMQTTQTRPQALILVLMALSKAKRRAKRTWRFSGSV